MLINGKWLNDPEIVCLIKQLEKENYELKDENLQLKETIMELTKENNND
jgi:hypothetical protein